MRHHGQQSLLRCTKARSVVACCFLLISTHKLLLAQSFTLKRFSFSQSLLRTTATSIYREECLLTLAASRSSSTAYLESLASTNAGQVHDQAHALFSSIPSEATELRLTRNPKYPNFPLEKYLANPFFQKINTAYPGLQLIHEEPYIFIINNFFTKEECARLRAKADSAVTKLRPQIGGGSVTRTSSGVVCVPEEVPTIQRKMMQLTNIKNPRQLQYLKVSKYKKGQTFSKHVDAWPTEGAPISTQGWVNARDFFGDERRKTVGCLPALEQPNHNTFMTSFVYLNTISEGNGGCTSFPNIGIHTGKDGQNFYDFPAPMDTLHRVDHEDGIFTKKAWDWEYRTTREPLLISPEEGMAVLHFCSLLPQYGGITDGNTFHIAEPPTGGQEKYVSQQFFSSCEDWILPNDSLPNGRVTWDTI